MTLKIELTPEEERRIRCAKAQGIDVTALIKGVLSGLPDAPAGAQGDSTLALLAQWAQEDATDDEAELERRDKETAEFMANLRANRLHLPIPKV